MNILKELLRKFKLFMRGRYGHDELNSVIMILYLISILLVYVVRTSLLNRILLILAMFFAIVLIFRTFSKNIYQRSKENEQYLKLKEKFIQKRDQPKGPVIVTCPNCSQKLRVPSGKGKIEIKCGRCGHKFTKRT